MADNYSKALTLIEKLEKKGVSLWKENDKIKFKANTGALVSEDLAELKQLKSELLELLDPEKRKVTLKENINERFEPFVLTDVQQSYLMGRSNLFDYGGVACHIYLQLNYDSLDVNRTEEIWNYLIARHEMLRTVIHEEGYQQIMESAPHFYVTDHHDTPAEKIMEQMGHEQFKVGSWPYFAVGVSNYENGAVMHFSIEFIIADWTSIWMLLHQFEELYFGRISEISEPDVSFRDYVIAEKELKESAACERDRHYWLSRMDDFPMCPQIETEPYSAEKEVRFDRKFLQLSPERWENIKNFAYQYNVTPTVLVLMAYAHTLSCYSENKRFSINLTMLNRQPLHKNIGKVIGDFTSLTLLDIDLDNDDPFIENVKRTNMRLFEDMDHNLYSGVAFMREIANKKGSAAASMPYVFTSAVGLLSSMENESVSGMLSGIGISQTPQVFIDCQVMDGSFGMQVNWDVRRGVFKDGMIDDMFTLFSEMLQSMANQIDPETVSKRRFPDYQKEIFTKANDTALTLPVHLLHTPILHTAEKYPDKTAVVAGDEFYTYSELMQIAGKIYNALMENGIQAGDTVGITVKKSVYQPAAALAILSAGGIYVPISTEQGANRISSIIKQADIRLVITLENDETAYPENVAKIYADAEGQSVPLPKECPAKPESLAYIIFTSGSTGEPKGVAISHKACVNTIEDIIRRYNITSNDSVLGVSQLSFDLSVFDIFGLLSVGGTVVYPEDSRKKEPEYLAGLIQREHITVWNSVPSLLNMITVYLDHETQKPDISSLRLVLLSGDWIPLNLPDKILSYSEKAQVVSLGGATEASIWSIYHDYNGISEGFASIPYGLPLANQQFRILDSRLHDRPVGVKGDIFILGDGLADCYYHDKARTDLQFIKDPVTGKMMYKTGDIGKYHINGEIEFLGRADSQIKFNGHRIELGEIESAVSRSGLTANCSVVYHGSEKERAIICFYEPAFADDNQKRSSHAECAALAENIEVEARSVMKDVDTAKVGKVMEQENKLLYTAMSNALRDAVGGKKSFTIADINASEKILEKHKWLVNYWIALLEKETYLKEENGNYIFCDTGISKTEIRNEWDKLGKNWLAEMGSSEFFEYIRNSAMSLNGLLSGETDPVKLLYPDGKTDVVSDMYIHNKISVYLNNCICEFVRNASELGRPLRILEIGAGTCATALRVTKALADREFTYYVTDINSHFLPLAQAKFEGVQNVRFSVLNIDNDISEQGFEENSFDIVIAVGVLENAKDIRYSLQQVKRLVRPCGYFLFTEPVREEAWILASQGFLMTPPQDELRKNKAFINSSEWVSLLNETDTDSSVKVLPAPGDELGVFGLELYFKQFKTTRQNINSSDIISKIRENLASYMIPSIFMMLDKIPVTVNGKTDNKTLRRIAEQRILSSTGKGTEHNDTVSADMNALQKELAEILGGFGLKNLGLHDSFYDYGADSLILAQATGGIRDKILKDVPFDTLLRFMLNHPNIQELSEFVAEKRGDVPENNGSSTEAFAHIGASTLYKAGNGPLRVVFHAAFGTMNSLKYVVEGLVKQQKGDVLTIALGDADKYYQMDRESAIQQLADDYTQIILESGAQQIQLIGYCFGGWLATQCANRLVEQGKEIADIILIDSQTVPWNIEDRLMIELMFLPNFSIALNDLDCFVDSQQPDLEALFMELISSFGKIPEPLYTVLEKMDGCDGFAKGLKQLADMDFHERFRMYTEIGSRNTGEQLSAAMLEGVFKSYCQTIRCCNGDMESYFGDIRFLNARDNSNIFYSKDKNISYWSELCIGDLHITDIAGDHYSCVEDPENAKEVCRLIADHEA